MAKTLDRIEGIDALRGMALLGVLLINLDTEFRTTFFEQFLPVSYQNAADKIARATLGFLVEFKAITIFSMLFGVGLAIQRESIGSRGPVAWLLARRMLVLLGFGLIHLTLIWNGDILTEYALAGLVALPFLFGPTWLLLGSSAAAMLIFLSIPFLPFEFPFPNLNWMSEHIAQAKLVYGNGGFLEIMRFRIAEIPALSVYLIYIFPRTLSLILFGAWAWRCGFLRDDAARGNVPVSAGWIAVAAGLILSWLNGSGISAPMVLEFRVKYFVDVLAPIILAIGYSILALRYFGPSSVRITAWFAAVGRMAFTNYILQSVVLGLLFFGYGFGLLGQLGVLQGVAVALALFAGQIWLSRVWLSRYRMGPLEWLWRSLMYGKVQPI
jgi:uncharacterized protein